MTNDEFIMMINLSYLIINLIFYIIFFVTTIFDDNEKDIHHTDNVSMISSLRSGTISRFFYICLFIINWLRLGFLLPNLIQSCLIQSYFLHVFTHFHFHFTVCLRLYWYYCLVFENSLQKITYRQIFFLLLFLFICLCLITLPSLSNEWASVIYDQILQICIVNYTFNYSYTFFVLTLSGLIPFILLIISHQQQIENRQWNLSSCFSLIWSFFNLLLLICLHIPMKYIQIRMMIYYIQIISFLFEPIFYIFSIRLLFKIILLRPINENDFL